MASVNWDKQTRQKAGAMQKHLNRRERVEVEHSNKDIDVTRSHLNYYIGCDDYKDAYKAMCRRVDEEDAINPPQRVVKDRVVCVSLEAPCPEEIFTAGRSEEFFRELHKTYENFFGKENVHGSCVHLDEMHRYVDNGVEKNSLAHAHTLVSAYAEWQQRDKKTGAVTERRGINGKNFETKARINALNKAVCDMVRDKFGVEYNTGEKAGHKTVEQLKAQSELDAKKKETADYVRSLTPTPTKTVKGVFGGTKEVPKSEEELQRDKDVLAAQEILKDRDSIAENAKDLERKSEQLKRQEYEDLAWRQELKSKEDSLNKKAKQWEIDKQLESRAMAQRIIDKGGYVPVMDVETQRRYMQERQEELTEERSVQYGRSKSHTHSDISR